MIECMKLFLFILKIGDSFKSIQIMLQLYILYLIKQEVIGNTPYWQYWQRYTPPPQKKI